MSVRQRKRLPESVFFRSPHSANFSRNLSNLFYLVALISFSKKRFNFFFPKCFFSLSLIRFFPIYKRAGTWCSGWSFLLGKSEIAGSSPALAFKFQRNKMFLPRSLVKIQYCGEPPWETARARISNSESGGQSPLIHLTILRRFSWPSLAYMCT